MSSNGSEAEEVKTLSALFSLEKFCCEEKQRNEGIEGYELNKFHLFSFSLKIRDTKGYAYNS